MSPLKTRMPRSAWPSAPWMSIFAKWIVARRSALSWSSEIAGTVHVSRMMRVERFSHVMHIVSTVQGKIRAGISPLKVLFACFPAGTLSGAPKFRAMELIESHEQASRGLYGGAVVQVGFNGFLDSCIAIRSALYHQGQVCIQAGAGIVFDSRSEMEFEETLHKSRVLREVCR